MARLPDKSSRFVLIATFIICSSILFIDFRFGAFKPVQNFYNSSSIFIRLLSKEYIARPQEIILKHRELRRNALRDESVLSAIESQVLNLKFDKLHLRICFVYLQID